MIVYTAEITVRSTAVLFRASLRSDVKRLEPFRGRWAFVCCLDVSKRYLSLSYKTLTFP